MPIAPFAALLLAPILAVGGPAAAFDPKPWLEDLDQTQRALAGTYANLEWAVFEREIDLTELFADTRKRLLQVESDAEARAVFDRMGHRLGDGHVEFKWPAPDNQPAPAPLRVASAAQGRCETLGYNKTKIGNVLGESVVGYLPLQNSRSNESSEFPAGIVKVGGRSVGILKIGLFSPEGSPALCEAALAELKIAPDNECNAECRDQISVRASAKMTLDLAAQIRALHQAGARALVIDLTNNGGGSEWAEAAARMVTPIRLSSERIAFVRGEHWSKTFASHQSELKRAAKAAKGADAVLLNRLADEAARELAEAKTPCDSAPLWRGEHTACAWLGKGTFGSGLLDAADPRTLREKPWATLVFNPMWFPYEEGVWRGPLLVLVDGTSWSASEEFAAVLQDNKAALIIGMPTGGAGCGHTDGGTPTILNNSQGKLEVPDCVRLRADGSNEVSGVRPDVLIGLREFDGPRKRAALLLSRLPEALERAAALRKTNRPGAKAKL